MGLNIYFRASTQPVSSHDQTKEIWSARSWWDFHKLIVDYLEETRKIPKTSVNDQLIELFYDDIINLGCITATNGYDCFSLWEELEHSLYKQHHVYYHPSW
jgi:hypothetical protein